MGRLLSDVVVLSVMAAGVTSIAILLASSTRTSKLVDALLAIIAVLAVWALLNTTYALRYARLYYRDPPGATSFNTTEPPRYSEVLLLRVQHGDDLPDLRHRGEH